MTDIESERRDAPPAGRAAWSAPVLRQAEIRRTAVGGLEPGELEAPAAAFDS